MVIAHSLGTIVTYETLVLNPALAVPVLVTVGSPLGMRVVTSRLRRADGGRGCQPVMPAGLGRWVNIYDPGDPVAAGGLSRLWPPVKDYTVGNGKDPRAIRAYLGKQITGRTVLDGVA